MSIIEKLRQLESELPEGNEKTIIQNLRMDLQAIETPRKARKIKWLS